MAQVILIEENENLRELLSLNLSTYVGAEVIPRENAEDALALLNILPGISLVISNSKIGDENTEGLLTEYFKNSNTESGLIVIGPSKQKNKDVAVYVENQNDWEKILQASAKILGVTQAMMDKKVRPDFVPIPVRIFLLFNTSCCDVFIRIKKGADEYQYVKRIHNGDTFSKKSIQRYLDQDLENFYIPKESQQNFTNFASDQLVEKLNSLEKENAPVEETIEVLADSYQFATQEILKFGFNSATLQLTESVVGSMVNSALKNPEMGPLLHKIINSKTSYMYQHCHMTCVVASDVLTALGHKEKTAHEKIAYASFFHDISFVDNEELAKITSFEELEAANLSEEDWDLVFNHALESSILIRKNSEAPLGVDEIVKTHHGAINGKGFTSGTLKMSGISKIFFIACEFVKEVLAYKEKGGPPAPVIEELYRKWPDPETVKVIKALEKTLQSSP